MSSKLTDALRQKFRTPEAALAALGIDATVLDEGKDAKMTTRYTSARRLGRDQKEDAREELREMLDDPDVSAGDMIAALVEYCPDDQRESLHDALNEIANDVRAGRSYRQHARDRLERGRYARDARSRRPRRMGRDLAATNLTESESPRIEEFLTEGQYRAEEGEDRRRRMGADSMAFDRSPASVFTKMFPGASRVERA